MKEDYVASFAGKQFKCLDKGFDKNEDVDIVIRPEDVDIVSEEAGMLKGTITSVTFRGVHFEIIVDIGGFKWMIQTTDEHKEGENVGLFIEPDAIHVMKKSKYSGMYGDYSSYSDELDELNVIDDEEDE
jgi:spermidine/putrescine transport system ATP-binding protein